MYVSFNAPVSFKQTIKHPNISKSINDTCSLELDSVKKKKKKERSSKPAFACTTTHLANGCVKWVLLLDCLFQNGTKIVGRRPPDHTLLQGFSYTVSTLFEALNTKTLY